VLVIDPSATLDREQLRQVTSGDEELMREIVEGLVADTAHQLGLLETAIKAENGPGCMRLAHYSRGACANVGAGRAAGLFLSIENHAADNRFAECSTSLAALTREVELLRAEIVSL
jgi:HPt (histidine-containing phosphotransfer) domain-containing protein